MNKEEIVNILNLGHPVPENKNQSALEIVITQNNVSLHISVPYGVTEVYYEARDHNGALIIEDWHDHYGDSETEDYIDTLKQISSAMKSPSFRINNNKTVELLGDETTYFFGETGGKYSE